MEKNNHGRKTRDVFELITEGVIAQLKKGIIPWRKTWTDTGIPRNLFTQRFYRGINLWLLSSAGYQQNYFLTFKQVKQLGGTVRKGEKGTPLIYWKKKEIDSESLELAEKWFLQCYMVYNVAQCDGLTKKFANVSYPINKIEECEKIVANMPLRPAIKFVEEDVHYHPLEDTIYIPEAEKFDSDLEFYTALFKNLIHSTGHASRLARREIINDAEWGSQKYTIEQLTCELGACYLLSHTGFNLPPGYEVGYLQTWLYYLRCDKKLLVNAGSQAQKAVDFILNVPKVGVKQELEVRNEGGKE